MILNDGRRVRGRKFFVGEGDSNFSEAETRTYSFDRG